MKPPEEFDQKAQEKGWATNWARSRDEKLDTDEFTRVLYEGWNTDGDGVLEIEEWRWR